LQAHLRKIDDFFAVPIARLTGPRAARRYFELMYLTAYPVVPAGLALLRFAVPGFEADAFWSVVLPATYFCYFMLPFAPTLPPRMEAAEDSVGGEPAGEPRPARRLNLWILDRFGIGANTFPSGHVAVTTATSLVVLEYLPFTGLLFLWMSLGIAVGAVVLRYHYLADAVLGALVALLVRWIIGA
jgi:membrane-associated phospholipid phosphatase